jgi:adenylate cyclase
MGVFAVLLGMIFHVVGVFEGAELDTVDARFEIRGEQAPRGDVVVVGVDDVTFNDLGEQWPFPRSLHGKLIDRLEEAGAKTISYDVQFTEPTEPAEDNALIRAVQQAGDVVLATTEVDAQGRSNVFGGEEVLRSIGARSGNALVTPGSDGIVRQVESQIQGLETFAVVSADVAAGTETDTAGWGEGGAWIDFAGPPGTIPTYSFSRVLAGKFEPGAFRGRTVVVGATAPSLQDVHPTSAGGGLMPGPEVQASAISTILDGAPLDSTPPALNILLIVLLGAVGPIAGMRLKPGFALGLMIGFGLLYVAVAQLAFDSGLIIPVVDPLLALVIGSIGTLFLYYLFEAFDRQRVRLTFSRFVPENVVDQVLADGQEGLRLGGVRMVGTVMFTDLRGFTSYAESKPPTEVVQVLNQYLGEMTEAIMDHGGTLVAYMGDGIMAAFGAPVQQEDHADRAVAAAREMLEDRLPAFCDWMKELGHGEGFEIGIGLNSGEVMSGQVGSEKRMEYTTIGDTTNTAARLEGMTKGSGYSLFISDSTRRALVDPVRDLVPVGEREVRGRDRKIEIWSLAPAPGARSATDETPQAEGRPT